MISIGIIGPESTGKSTLAVYLANRYKGLLIPEYARTYMELLNRPYTYEDVVAIAKHQIDELRTFRARLKNSDTILFFDTELIITKVWFEHKYGACPQWLEEAIREYPMDTYLLTYPDIEWKPDPVRENPDIRLQLFRQYEKEVQKLNIPYYIIKHCN